MTTERVSVVWATIHGYLREEMQRIREEIRNYSAPIPACDAQFNYLLEKRDALESELGKARRFMSENTGSRDHRGSVEQFLKASICLDEAQKDELRSLMNEAG